MSASSDGRRARGEERRRRLIDAALVVLGRDGLAGLSHRAVAAEAGVSLASASYHFAGIEDLLEQAMERGNEEFLAAAAARTGEPGPRQLARLIAEEVNANRQLILAEYEVYLHSARHGRPSRSSVLAWLEALCDIYAPELDAAQRQALAATIEGISIHAVIAAEPADPATIERTLRLAWPR